MNDPGLEERSTGFHQKILYSGVQGLLDRIEWLVALRIKPVENRIILSRENHIYDNDFDGSLEVIDKEIEDLIEFLPSRIIQGYLGYCFQFNIDWELLYTICKTYYLTDLLEGNVLHHLDNHIKIKIEIEFEGNKFPSSESIKQFSTYYNRASKIHRLYILDNDFREIQIIK